MDASSRKGFNQVMEDIELGHVKRLIIGYEDRFVRFGYDWFESFCERHGTKIVVTNGWFEALCLPNERCSRRLVNNEFKPAVCSSTS